MPEQTATLLYAFSAALGVGLLIGLVRERGHAMHATAGLRTHALVALSAAVAPPASATRMFRFGHALGFALLVGGMVLLAAVLSERVGAGGAMAAAVIAAAAELHASIATLGSLRVGGTIDAAQGRWLMVGLLAASMGAKSVLAMASGGRGYGLRVAAGLLAALAAGVAAAALAPG